MKKITSLMMLFLMLLGTGSLKAATFFETVKPGDLKTGDFIRLMVQPVEGNQGMEPRYMCFNNGGVYTDKDANAASAIWTLKAAATEGQFYLYNETAKKYAGKTPNNGQVPMVAAEGDAGAYLFQPVNNSELVVVKCNNAVGITENAEFVYLTFQSNSSIVVRWGAGGAHSQWTLQRKVEREVVPTDEYPVKVDPSQEYTRTDRHLDALVMNSKAGSQSLAIPTPRKVFTQLLNQSFKAQAGEKVKVDFLFTGHHMHGYVYVDFNNDGQFGTELHKELMTYAYLGGKDSDGKEANAGNVNPPAFTLPADVQPGVYRMRCKVDWDNVDPAGSSEKAILENAGSFTDMALYIYGNEGKVKAIANEVGTITAVDGTALPATAATGKSLKVKVTPKNEGDMMAVVVRHGFNVEGDQYVKGLVQYREDKVVAGPDHIVTIPADYMDGDVQLTAVQSDCVLIFSDEFDGADMTQPDASKWRRSIRYGATWNRWISNAEDVIYMKNGKLIARAVPNPNPTDADPFPMRTGAIESAGHFDFRYGKVECRAKANLFAGTFPAIWMMPANPVGGWPSCGEIDIFEAVNTQAKAHHTIHSHWTFDLKKGGNTSSENVNFDEYHVYGLEWDDTSLTFLLDGKKVWTYHKSKNANDLKQNQWPFDRNFYLILNQSVGNHNQWASYPDVNHTYEFLVDWIRVFQNPHHAKECELRARINKVQEYDFYEGVNGYTVDQKALDAAKAVLADAANRSVEELAAAVKSLDNYITINQPEFNNFYRVRCAGNGMKFIQSTQTANGKQQMVSGDPGRGVEGTFLYTKEGLISYTQGLYCGKESLLPAGETMVAEFGNMGNDRIGQYSIKMNGNYLLGEGEELSFGGLTSNYNDCSGGWWLEPVNELQVNFKGNETSGFYATLYSPMNLTLPEGVKAYVGQKKNEALVLTEVQGVPANQGVLLIAQTGGVKVFSKMNSTIEMPAENDLVGQYATVNKPEGEEFYGLGYGTAAANADKVGFYLMDNLSTLKGFRARVKKDAANAANELKMTFGDATGIETLEEVLAGKAQFFDLSGRRVVAPEKGIYIVNGKKVYIK